MNSYDVTTLRGRRADSRLHRLSMGDIFERIRWSDPDRIVLTGLTGAAEGFGETSLTVAEADDGANRFANALLSSGACPGDIALMVCENSIEAIIAKIGMAKAGVTVVPLNPHFAQDVVVELVSLTNAKWALIDAEFSSRMTPIFDEAGVSTLAAIAVGGRASADEPTFSQFIAEASWAEPDVVVHGDDIWEIQFTSGTSALPKGVMHSHTKTMIEALSGMGIATRGQDFESEATLGIFIPVTYHVSEVIVFSTVLAGGRAVIGRRPNSRELAQAIDAQRITTVYAGSPQMLEGLSAALDDEPEWDASCVASVMHSFAPLDPAAYDFLHSVLGTRALVVEVIGQTELCVMHRFWLGQREDVYRRAAPQVNYVGLPHPMMAAALMREDGSIADVEAGESGEGVYRSPALTAGYFKQHAETDQAFAGGWFHSGDSFVVGEEGQRFLRDRVKDIIKTGGENVSSLRVEATLSRHIGVERAVAIGLPHPQWGEAVTVLVKRLPGTDLSRRELLSFAKEHLAGFEVPKDVVFVEEFPETVGNKVQKQVLRNQLADFYTTGSA